MDRRLGNLGTPGEAEETKNESTRRHQEIMIPYEYVDRRGERVVTDWPLQARQMRQVKGLLIRLEQVDRELAVGSILFKMKLKHIYYAKIRGEVALRPRVCLGPALDNELTFLERVEKKGGRERPGPEMSRATVRLRALVRGTARRVRVALHKKKWRS